MAQLHRRRLRQLRIVDRVDQRPGLAAGDFEQQLGRALHRDRRQLRIDAALEVVRRIGVHAEAARLAGQLGRGEMRRLEEDVAGFRLYRAVEAAHDAGQRDRAGVIGDHERVRVALDFALVEQSEFFARLGEAHANAAL